MRKRLIAVISAVILAGCAAGPSEQYFTQQDYFRAYQVSVIVADPAKRRELAKRISDTTRGGQPSKFYDQTLNHLETERDPGDGFFVGFGTVVTYAVEDGLLSKTQANDLLALAQQMAELAVLRGRTIPTNRMRPAYPDFGSPASRARAAKAHLAALTANPSSDLSGFFSLASYYKETNDQEAVALVRNAMRSRVASLLSSRSISPMRLDELKPIFQYIKVTGDRTFDSLVDQRIRTAALSKADLEDQLLNELFGQLAREQLEARVVSVGVFIEGNDFVAGEIADELKKVNEWVVLDNDPKIKIQLTRFRMAESHSNPYTATETVSDLDFLTLLFIPKNASVLFDYVKTEHSVQWNAIAIEPKGKKTKPISGSKKAIKVTCQNIRYQNVFGGVGALSNYPNDRVKDFCTSNKDTDFEASRAGAIREIAQQIDTAILR